MIPNVINQLKNSQSQTAISVFGDNSPFNFENDSDLIMENEFPKLDIDQTQVEGIIKPLTIGKNGNIVSHHVPRLYKKRTEGLIRGLLEGINENPEAKGDLIRQMATYLIPGLSNPDYRSLYSHGIHLPYKSVTGVLTKKRAGSAPEKCTAVFSLNERLTILTDKETIICEIELWDKISAGREVSINKQNEAFGKLILDENVDPIASDRIPPSVLRWINIRNEEELVNIIRPDDISFVDVTLSIPSLTKNDANDLLALLHTKGMLLPYIRCKVSSLLLMDPTAPSVWPELIGRLIFLLDPRWCLENISLLKNNDVMALFRHIKKMKDSALYVLQTAFFAIEENKSSDTVLVFWTLLFLSILPNATFNKPEHSKLLQKRMLLIWKELQKKGENSNTRKLSREIIDHVMNIKQFKLAIVQNEELEFIKMILHDKLAEVHTILSIIPFRKEQSHPLYYPVYLALENALNQAKDNESLCTSDSESTIMNDFDSITSENGTYQLMTRQGKRIRVFENENSGSVRKESSNFSQEFESHGSNKSQNKSRISQFSGPMLNSQESGSDVLSVKSLDRSKNKNISSNAGKNDEMSSGLDKKSKAAGLLSTKTSLTKKIIQESEPEEIYEEEYYEEEVIETKPSTNKKPIQKNDDYSYEMVHSSELERQNNQIPPFKIPTKQDEEEDYNDEEITPPILNPQAKPISSLSKLGIADKPPNSYNTHEYEYEEEEEIIYDDENLPDVEEDI